MFECLFGKSFLTRLHFQKKNLISEAIVHFGLNACDVKIHMLLHLSRIGLFSTQCLVIVLFLCVVYVLSLVIGSSTFLLRVNQNVNLCPLISCPIFLNGI